MSNCLIAFGNVADDAALSGGAWSSMLPLNNIKDKNVKKVARSLNTDVIGTTFIANLAASTHIGALSLEGTNASINAQARWRTYTDASRVVLVYDSGIVSVYPDQTLGFGSVPWGAVNWWTGKPLAADVARFQNAIRHVPAAADFAQCVVCEIFDTTNPAGYFQAGRLFVGSAFQPRYNTTFGDTMTLKPRTTLTRGLDGTRYFNRQRPDFDFAFALKYMDRAESQRILDLEAQVDMSGEILFFSNPNEIAYRFRTSIFGQLTKFDPISNPMISNYESAFQIEGTL